MTHDTFISSLYYNDILLSLETYTYSTSVLLIISIWNYLEELWPTSWVNYVILHWAV